MIKYDFVANDFVPNGKKHSRYHHNQCICVIRFRSPQNWTATIPPYLRQSTHSCVRRLGDASHLGVATNDGVARAVSCLACWAIGQMLNVTVGCVQPRKLHSHPNQPDTNQLVPLGNWDVEIHPQKRAHMKDVLSHSKEEHLHSKEKHPGKQHPNTLDRMLGISTKSLSINKVKQYMWYIGTSNKSQHSD